MKKKSTAATPQKCDHLYAAMSLYEAVIAPGSWEYGGESRMDVLENASRVASKFCNFLDERADWPEYAGVLPYELHDVFGFRVLQSVSVFEDWTKIGVREFKWIAGRMDIPLNPLTGKQR